MSESSHINILLFSCPGLPRSLCLSWRCQRLLLYGMLLLKFLRSTILFNLLDLIFHKYLFHINCDAVSNLAEDYWSLLFFSLHSEWKVKVNPILFGVVVVSEGINMSPPPSPPIGGKAGALKGQCLVCLQDGLSLWALSNLATFLIINFWSENKQDVSRFTYFCCAWEE